MKPGWFALNWTLLWLPSLIGTLLPTSVLADVIAVTRRNVSYTFPSMPSNFGDRLSLTGFEGKLVVADPLNGCGPMQRPPRVNSSGLMSYNFFALIRRDVCNFDIKVWNAQKVGYSGAIVYNINGDDGVLSMTGDTYGQDVYIPSVFVGASSGAALKKLNYTTGTNVTLTPTLSFPVSYFLFPFVIVTSTCLVFFGIYMVAKYVRDRRQLKRSRLSRTNLKKIPIKKFTKGDDYDVCAICLDDYEEGDKLRILPCNHAFHCKCVDPWLTNNRRTCPVCKRKVVPSGQADSDDSESDSDSDSDGSGPGSPTEHTPLLIGSGSGGSGSSRSRATVPPLADTGNSAPAAAYLEVEGAWGGEDSRAGTLVDASTAMTENDLSDEDDTSRLCRPSVETPSAASNSILATPTLHPIPDEEPVVNCDCDDETVPSVVVVNEKVLCQDKNNVV